MNLKSKKSIMAFVLCICLIAMLSLSYLYIFTHNNHNCTGRDCPVCEQIHIAEHIIEQIRNAINIVAVFYTAVFFLCHCIEMTYILLEKDSPVKRKVRLNN